MYRFLDRPLDELDEHLHFLVSAMRHWTMVTRGGRCACRALAPAFAWRGVSAALPDFATVMAALDREGKRWLRFGAATARAVSDDEAVLLALVESAMHGERDAARRIAATLVTEPALARTVTAIEWVALRFLQAPLAQRDGAPRQA
ncbi:hypothetical protein KZ813_18695 [Sphingomonas sp. RHCKR7]|uniref:hypothetical protein n=1 Tax=Sphingomonas folli TaxID=2862497 RepID=UPI001CA4EAA3|nr:hypothetical protein [Sphingomonas folli]MBW6528873.1 hypothetical protein [Sphingomonas folli]